jgi:hypothetical protein
VVDTVLGLLGIVVYAVGVLSLSAGVTYLVVKLSPSKSARKPEPPAPADT